MKKKKGRILTGDRPTGKLHLGHYAGSLANRVQLQYDYDTFLIIADVQALTTNFAEPENLARDVRQVALDYLAAGIDPKETTIFVQSMVPEIAELTVFLSMLTTVNVLRHNPTIKSEAAQRGYKDLTYGFLGYPVSQTADITFCKANLVPVGEDQVPHIEYARKLVRRFNSLYCPDRPVLVEPEALLSRVPRLVGLDGNAKMSKSLDNAIYLCDEAADIEERVRNAVTDPSRIRKTDPGHPDVCTIYAYHKAFNLELEPEIRGACEGGKIGCVECKKRLATCINNLLEPMRERREYYLKRPNEVDDILITGTRRARKEGRKTLAEVREAMSINYFKI